MRVTVSYPFLAVLTVFLLLDHTGLGGQMLCAALLHELGHLFVMYLLRQPPRGINLVPFGIRIVKSGSVASYGKEALVYLAGPAVNLLCAGILLFTSNIVPRLALVHLVLGLFNLLPIGALDGGRLFSCLMHWLGGPRFARLAVRVLSIMLILPIAAGAFFLVANGQGNITLIITSLYLAAMVLFGKD